MGAIFLATDEQDGVANCCELCANQSARPQIRRRLPDLSAEDHPALGVFSLRHLLSMYVVFNFCFYTDHPFSKVSTQYLTLTPMHPLPIELWEEIFVHCLPNVPGEAWNSNVCVTPGMAPLLLCRVCKLWRQISIELPYLWVSLPVFVSMGNSYPPPDFVRLWLARSGHLPLLLSLYQQNESDANCFVAEEVLRVFSQHASRWYSMQLHLSRNARLPNLESQPTPVLETYKIQSVGVDALMGLKVVPRLLHIHVSHIPDFYLSGDRSITVPWSQLTSLSLDSVSVEASIRILFMCPNLGKCSYTIDTHHGAILFQSVVHVMLTSLIVNISHNYLSTFLEHLTLPQLFQVAVYSNDRAEWPQDTFSRFLERSSCHLRQLEVYNAGMSSAHFLACVLHPCLQSLEELVIDDFGDWSKEPFVVDEILTVLSRSSLAITDTVQLIKKPLCCLLPHLEKLVLLNNRLVARDGAFADMVGSRLRYPSYVRGLRWLECELSVDHTEDHSRLHDLQRNGFLVCYATSTTLHYLRLYNSDVGVSSTS